MKTPIGYYGGKQNLVKEILPLFPDHVQYVEPFTGGGAVFFAKHKSKNEVINDLNEWVVNFYWQLKNNFIELQKLIHGTLHSEVLHSKAAEILKTNSGTELERAWAFWVRTNMSFGHVLFGGFAFSEEGKAGGTANKRDGFIDKYCLRLRDTEIFQRDAVELIELKDSENTFFYCDPPYISSDCTHYDQYTMDHFKNLLDVLSNIKGKFLMSSYPEDLLIQYRKDKKWNYKDIIQVLQIIGKRKETKYKTECLTWNYELKNKQKTLEL